MFLKQMKLLNERVPIWKDKNPSVAEGADRVNFLSPKGLTTVNPRISPLGAYLLSGFLHGGLFEGGIKIFPAVGHIPVEIILQINYFFDAAYRSNRMFSKEQTNFR